MSKLYGLFLSYIHIVFLCVCFFLLSNDICDMKFTLVKREHRIQINKLKITGRSLINSVGTTGVTIRAESAY